MKHIILNRDTKLAHECLSLKMGLTTFLPFCEHIYFTKVLFKI